MSLEATLLPGAYLVECRQAKNGEDLLRCGRLRALQRVLCCLYREWSLTRL